MRTLNKVFFAILLSIVTIGFANAQSIKLGIKGGLNVSTLSGFNDFINTVNEMGGEIPEISSSYKPGFHVGAVAQFGLGNFFLQPELLFSQVGIAQKIGDSKLENGNLNYLQLPIYAGYKASLGLGLDLLLGAGPYFAYGISGTDDPFKENEDGMTAFQRFDAGLTFMGGIQISNLQVTLGYDLGLVDMIDIPGWNTMKDVLDLSSITNQNIKVSVAYFF